MSYEVYNNYYYHKSLYFLERNGLRFVHWSKRVTWFGCDNTIPVISGTPKWIKSACMHQCNWPLIDWLHVIVHINSIILLLHTVSIFSNLRHGCCAVCYGAKTFKSGDCWKILPTSFVQWRYVGHKCLLFDNCWGCFRVTCIMTFNWNFIFCL